MVELKKKGGITPGTAGQVFFDVEAVADIETTPDQPTTSIEVT